MYLALQSVLPIRKHLIKMMVLYFYLDLLMLFKMVMYSMHQSLKIRLADDSAETLGGRSTLIIVPNQ